MLQVTPGTETEVGIDVRSPLRVHASCAIAVFSVSKHLKASS